MIRGRGSSSTLLLALVALAAACEAPTPRSAPLAAQAALSTDDFSALVERISERGGYFDTDNLISNETGYLNVIGALGTGVRPGGAYVGVGPDQNFSYIAEVRPAIAFITDVRRDNLLHHLLLKALVERAPTRLEFLAGLHGLEPPEAPAQWRDRPIEEIVEWIDERWAGADPGRTEHRALLDAEVADRIRGYRLDLTGSDFETIARFHRTFMDAGLALRFTTFGRPPRPYYPTYRQLVLETDADGDLASYLAEHERYAVVRRLHTANRIVPVVGDMAGGEALAEMGVVMREFGVELSTFYASNAEFYLWRAGTFDSWVDNLRGLPARDDAVVVRSYFPNFGGSHPSSIAGYYATQLLQPVSVLSEGGFTSYWDVVTSGVLPLR